MRNDCGLWLGKQALSRYRGGVTFPGDGLRAIREAAWRGCTTRSEPCVAWGWRTTNDMMALRRGRRVKMASVRESMGWVVFVMGGPLHVSVM